MIRRVNGSFEGSANTDGGGSNCSDSSLVM